MIRASVSGSRGTSLRRISLLANVVMPSTSIAANIVHILLAALTVSVTGCNVSGSPEVRYHKDDMRNRMWFLSHREVIFYETKTRRKTKILLPNWKWTLVPDGCPPDLALGPSGEPLITSNISPTIWRIDPDTFRVSVHTLVLHTDVAEDVGFCGLVYSADQQSFFAVGSEGSLWKFDSVLEQARQIRLSQPIAAAYDLNLQSQPVDSMVHVRLCAHASQTTWVIDLSPDERVAEVKAARCAG